ncbi:hypothetical protein [Thermococcus sp. 21S7]|uniref:hypothetical protein n=1 Tax=Thermococcus sp. 21S7 TaxID=1638221 RepID=UPI00143B0A0B|nr:hypothetical protein [Thermococcus sp. 21S7]
MTYAIFPGKERYKDMPILMPTYIPALLPARDWEVFMNALENGSKDCIEFKKEIESPRYRSIWDCFHVYGPVFVTFNITNVTNSTAVILVTLKMMNVSPTVYCTLKSLTFQGKILLNLTDGYYYLNGTKIGRPSFFILPYSLPEKGSLLYRASLLRKYDFQLVEDLTVKNVTFKEGKLVHTFVRTFHPPLIAAKSSRKPILYQKAGYLSSSLRIDSLYDLDTGVAVDMSFPYPELYSIGIVEGDDFNPYSAELNDKIDFSKEYWPYEFVLYKTNIQFPKEQTGKAPDTVLKYYLLLGLAILGIVGVLKLREVRK